MPEQYNQFPNGEFYRLSNYGTCKFCGAAIAWMEHKRTRRTHPHDYIYDENGKVKRTTDMHIPVIGDSHTKTCIRTKPKEIEGKNLDKIEGITLEELEKHEG